MKVTPSLPRVVVSSDMPHQEGEPPRARSWRIERGDGLVAVGRTFGEALDAWSQLPAVKPPRLSRKRKDQIDTLLTLNEIEQMTPLATVTRLPVDLPSRLRALAPNYGRREVRAWCDRHASPETTDDELEELFRNVHWCPRELGGVR